LYADMRRVEPPGRRGFAPDGVEVRPAAQREGAEPEVDIAGPGGVAPQGVDEELYVDGGSRRLAPQVERETQEAYAGEDQFLPQEGHRAEAGGDAPGFKQDGARLVFQPDIFGGEAARPFDLHPADVQRRVQLLRERRDDPSFDPALNGRYLQQRNGDNVEERRERRERNEYVS
jgi:hypothetical protein